MSATLIPNQKVRYLGLKMDSCETDRLPVQAINKRVAALEALRWRNYQLALLQRAKRAPTQEIN
jgi:hypothetical protein